MPKAKHDHPGTEKSVRMVRNSERGSFKRCRFQWGLNFGVVTGTPLKPLEDGRALRFGDLIHQALAVHYKPGKKRGPKPWLAFERIYKRQIEELEMERLNMKDEDKWLDARELGMAMLRGYYEEYHDRDEQYEVVSAEQVFQVPISLGNTGFGLGRIKVVIVGTLDGVWRELSGPKSKRDTFFKEYKTAASIDLTNLPFDEQAGTYWTYAPKYLWSKGLLPNKTYPSHILYSFLKKSLPDERPRDEDGRALNKPTKDALIGACEDLQLPTKGTVPQLMDRLRDEGKIDPLLLGEPSEKQPSPRFARQPVYRDALDRKRMHERVKAEVVEMLLVERGTLKLIKNPGPLYMPNCRGCPMRDPCELHETSGDDAMEEMLRSGYKSWEPYAAHELPERW
jgi:hypothetical protein